MVQRDGRLLDALYRNGPLSNQELSAILGVSPSTVSAMVTGLLDEGAVTLLDPGRFGGRVGPGKRRKRTIQLNPDYGFAAVVELDFDFVTVHVNRFDLECESTRRVPVARNNRDAILETVDTELQSLAAQPGDRTFLGVGFCLPGQVDSDNNIGVHNTRIENWDHVDFNRFSAFSPNVVTENVANAEAVGEHARGSARDVDDFLLLRVGNGAGMGIMIDGKLHRGHNFAAGEAGHVIVEESSGTTCTCGNRGCLESFVSRRAVMRELRRLRESEVPSGILSDLEAHDGEGIFRLLGEYFRIGDKAAYLVSHELAHKLGLAAANFVQILAPARIVLSGPIVNLGAPFLQLVEQTLRRYQLPWLPPVPVVYARNAGASAAQGVAMLVFRRAWSRAS